MKYIFYTVMVVMLIVFGGCFLVKEDFDNKIEKGISINETSIDETAKYIIPKETLEIPILIYHNIREIEPNDSEASKQYIVTPAEFERQMLYLQENGFNPITIGRFYNYFEGLETVWPAKPVVITFDDGTKSQWDNAYPILKKYNFVATFFIFTNPIGKSKNYLTWDQVIEMDNNGMEFGGHGYYHLYLNKITDKELNQEVGQSKKIIEEKLGKEIKTFSYPFGVVDDRVSRAVEDAGYKVARNITNGKVHKVGDLLNLDGYFVTNNFGRFKTIVGEY